MVFAPSSLLISILRLSSIDVIGGWLVNALDSRVNIMDGIMHRRFRRVCGRGALS